MAVISKVVDCHYELAAETNLRRREDGDGTRVLVDRLWPRGMSKAEAKVDLWLRAVAPSPDLRRWFGHDPGKWTEFRRRYWQELERNIAAVEELKKEIGSSKATLLYGTKDHEHSHVIVLKDFIEKA